MKKRKMLILALLVVGLVGVGITGGKYYMNEKAEKEKVELQTSDYSIAQEKILAKQMKNTFADIRSIKFDKNTIYKNEMTGYTSVSASILTANDEFSIEVDFPEKNKNIDSTLDGFLGKGGQLGETKDLIITWFTDGKDEEI